MLKTKPSKRASLASKKAKMRVAIAKDVLASLEDKSMVARTGTYVLIKPIRRGKQIITMRDHAKDLRDVLKTKVAHCEVCAKGAIFISAVNKYDNCPITSEYIENSKSAFQYPFMNDGGDILSRDLNGISQQSPVLLRYFSQRQLDVIEYAFEQGRAGFLESYTDKEIKEKYQAVEFGQKYWNTTERMRAIMQNIIENKGTFRPDRHKYIANA
jgi:hypothetical protein